MSYKTFLITAAILVACTTETVSPSATQANGVAKDRDGSSEECDYLTTYYNIDTTTTCAGVRLLLEPCARLFCKHDMANLANHADSQAFASGFGKCDWSWMPPSTPCE